LDIGAIWDLIILQPMLNSLIVLCSVLFNNFGLTIIALTIVVNAAMLPLTLKQLHASSAMQELQPKLSELQKKHAKDKQKLAAEQMKLYKESGISPTGCLLPMLVQMPIWLALYQSIIRVLAVSPEDFLGLSQYLYSWSVVYSMLPLGNSFLWLDLATPDKYLVLPILVGGAMWVQQKMVMTPSADPKQKSQGQMMLWMMPLMFAFFTLQFPSGLALFWVTSTVIRVVLQYFVTGWGGLAGIFGARKPARDKKYKKRIAQVEEPSAAAGVVEAGRVLGEEVGEGQAGEEQQRRSYPAPSRTVKHRPRGGKTHRGKKR